MPLSNFATNLKRLRQAAGLSQAQLGRRTLLPTRPQLTISDYEHGREPEPEHVERIAAALDVTPEALLVRPVSIGQALERNAARRKRRAAAPVEVDALGLALVRP